MSVFSCTVLFVSISQVIGCEDRLRNDLYCVEWGVKLYSSQPGLSIYAYMCCEERRCISCVMVVWWWWCLEAVARLGSLRAGALPSGPGRDRLLRTAVLRHFQRQRKSAAHARITTLSPVTALYVRTTSWRRRLFPVVRRRGVSIYWAPIGHVQSLSYRLKWIALGPDYEYPLVHVLYSSKKGIAHTRLPSVGLRS